MYHTTWMIVKDEVDSGDLFNFARHLHGAVTCTVPPGMLKGAPRGTASLSFSTQKPFTPGGEHVVFAEAAGEWLAARGARYAVQHPGGDWHHSGPGA